MSPVTLTERLAVLRAARRFTPEVLDAFGRFLNDAPEESLFRANPLVYAQEQGLPERLAIDLFLYATQAGILGFTWGVLCPNCAAFLLTLPGLRNLALRDCSLCGISVRPDDDNVEVAFTVESTVRHLRFHELESLDFRRDGLRVSFSSNRRVPAQMSRLFDSFAASIMSIEKVSPGETVERVLELSEGVYDVWAPAHHAWCHFNVQRGSGAHEQSLELFDGRFMPKTFNVEPGHVTFRLSNRGARPVVCGLARGLMPSREQLVTMNLRDLRCTTTPYFTGKMLVTSETFRELFHAESLPGETGFEFKNLTVLFTDLKGSTELYGRVGDFRAYGLVREHFEHLRNIIAVRGGSMVKTIGDAVMASFAEPVSALRAASEMNQAMERLVRDGERLVLKIGLHTGPCIAVDLNDRLDYFGQTVNLAARVQGAAEANEIVCTEAVFSSPGVQEFISSLALSVRRETALLKGVEGAVTLFRLK